jgi:hypothetical protein
MKLDNIHEIGSKTITSHNLMVPLENGHHVEWPARSGIRSANACIHKLSAFLVQNLTLDVEWLKSVGSWSKRKGESEILFGKKQLEKKGWRFLKVLESSFHFETKENWATMIISCFFVVRVTHFWLSQERYGQLFIDHLLQSRLFIGMVPVVLAEKPPVLLQKTHDIFKICIYMVCVLYVYINIFHAYGMSAVHLYQV